ncbi:MAG: DUF6114 domain-containing protein [Candidatus Bathyarchaeota archaeon]|nr:DUF6114 domain-containing protein [Candidatus Bathyarchaeota archaeon]
MGSSKKPEAAFALSLIAGIIFLINGALLGAVGSFIAPFIPGASETALVTGILSTLMVVGIILGIIVIVAALMLYRNPAQKTMWGIIILVLSIVSVFIGGGFGIGLILGIIGGILALRWKPK